MEYNEGIISAAKECYELIREEGSVPDLDWADLRQREREDFIYYAIWSYTGEKYD